jgi:hypothetical protein
VGCRNCSRHRSGTVSRASPVSAPLAGAAQQVSGDGSTAAITVGDHLTMRKIFVFNGLLARSRST